jgi:flagellar hook assembly protein FlgD
VTCQFNFNWGRTTPNPFNPTTSIGFSLPHSGYATLKIYNTLGEGLANLISGNLSAGVHKVEWNAANLPSGLYFYRLQAGEFVQTKKLLLLR